MSILDKITKGRTPRAQKVVIYGPEGFGKSTLASLFPDPLFLDVEGGTSQMAVNRLEREDLPDLRHVEKALEAIAKARPCGTVVVDTIDWMEQVALDAMITDAGSDKIQGIEDFGYGKGYTMLKERITLLLARFDAVIQNGMNVVLLAHSKVVKFEPPDGAGAYDRYELKLSKQVAPLIKEWADMLVFGNWRTQIAEKGKGDATKYKGVGGRERQMHCNRSAAWDAKNRHGLADVEKWEIATVKRGFEAVGAPWGEDAPPAGKTEAPGKPSSPAAGKVTTRTATTTGSVTGTKTTAEAEPKKPDPQSAGPAPSAESAPVTATASPSEAEPGKSTASDPAENAATAEPASGPAAVAPENAPLPTSADPIPGLERQEPEDKGLALIVGPHEAAVNQYMFTQRYISRDQTYRSCPANIRARIMKNPAGFLNVAKAAAGKEAA